MTFSELNFKLLTVVSELQKSSFNKSLIQKEINGLWIRVYECCKHPLISYTVTHMHGSKFSIKFCYSQPLFILIKSRLTLDGNVNNNRLWD